MTGRSPSGMRGGPPGRPAPGSAKRSPKQWSQMISRPISTAWANSEASAVIGKRSPGCTRSERNRTVYAGCAATAAKQAMRSGAPTATPRASATARSRPTLEVRRPLLAVGPEGKHPTRKGSLVMVMIRYRCRERHCWSRGWRSSMQCRHVHLPTPNRSPTGSDWAD